MKRLDDADDPRRRILVTALGLGLLGAGLPGAPARAASLLGERPGRLPPGQSIYRMQGEVQVNEAAAKPSTIIRPGDTIQTGRNSELVFVVGNQAMIMRSESQLRLEDARGPSPLSVLRLVTGKLLSVFGKTRHQVRTPVATIGIRGTGLYVESEPDRSYVCTCYGETVIGTADDAAVSETVVSRHHDAARYVLAGGGERLRPAPFVNHTDEELTLIEALVGRTPPFVLPGDSYSTPRRGDY